MEVWAAGFSGPPRPWALADDPVALKEGISAGASGHLLEDAQPETLKRVLEAAIRGQRIFQPRTATALGTQTQQLATAAGHLISKTDQE